MAGIVPAICYLSSVMNRYFLPASDWTEDVLVLTDDEAKHCTRVMRASEGDQIEVFDGAGRSAVAKIISIARREVSCKVLSVAKHRKVAHPITLCQAIPKGGNMELIVQKSVELGVSAIQPLMTDRTVARSEALAKKQAKWQRIALEACKQCGQNYLPEVKPTLTYSSWIQSVSSQGCFDTAVVAALDERAVHLKTLVQSAPIDGTVGLLVGPEGDLSAGEYQAAYDVGFQPISFGDIIMRVETASLHGISVLQHEISAPSTD